jgi:fructan beta-fructosidase
MRGSRMRSARVSSRRFGAAVAAALAVAVAVFAASASAAESVSATYQEPFRPQFHFSPAKNWMNDPNGLVYYKGEYHLFYQHNPFGDTWGHMSWGHAVSRDLVHWEHLPVAIPEQGNEAIFSGSAVVDRHNTSGLGTRRNPPMVAIYTSAYPDDQQQSLAYSTDRGRTWTKYSGNPVLDDADREFRDPKVFWYEPERKWVMVLAKAVQRKVAIYESKDLKSWRHLSDFGPANAVAGIWECPDLFQLPVDGDRRNKKWVMVVSLNPGSIAGGSGTQYFVGDFDGTRFTADNVKPYTPPAGEVYEDFEAPDYGDWTATGTAFGSGPATGTLPGQQTVSGFAGERLVNSFLDFDSSQGTLTSPTFRVTRDYINLLVGGGAHAHNPEAGDGTPPPGELFGGFESTYEAEGWQPTGDFAGTQPFRGGEGRMGEQIVDTFFGPNGNNGDPLTGKIVSPQFTITRDYINFMIAGGPHTGDARTSVDLVVDGQVARTASGHETGNLNWVAWSVNDLIGQTAQIEIVDLNIGGWGHILADHFMFADAPAKIRSDETAVNLLVGGDVVRSAAGKESEALDWVAWNVRDLIGQEAQIQIVDRNSGGWGHILADQITFADAPAESTEQRASWLDYGKDYYAAVSWNDVPDGRRLMIGWMNNWQYANQIPTSPWRSAMSVPREIGLRTLDGRTELVQSPIRELRALRTGPEYDVEDRTVQAGTWPLTGRGASGKALEIKAEFTLRDADRFGLNVRAGDDEATVIGYDKTARELYVDRTRSGNVGFNPNFPGVQRAPLAAPNGKVRLRILVDWSSVEVFTQEGHRVITDQIFPSATSDGIELFADGGSATLDSLKIRPLRSSWQTRHDHNEDQDD